MREYFLSRYVPLLDRIYRDLRCGLFHNLVSVSPWRGSGRSFLIVGDCQNHLAIEPNRDVFCVLAFLEDARRAWIIYRHNLLTNGNSDTSTVRRFNDKFDRLAGAGAFMVKAPDPK